MENKNVGWLIIGLSVVVIGIIFLFNATLRDFIVESCSSAHTDGTICPMFTTLNNQTYLALAIVAILILVGLVLIFSKPHERIIIRKVKEKLEKKVIDLSGLKSEEKQVYKIVSGEKAIFQADLIEKTGFGKAKMSRIIDRLEGRGLVERKRRGMTNIVALKG